MTLAERARSYAEAFPDRPPLVVHGAQSGRAWLYGVWEIGNDYRSSTGFYGSYPPSYLARLAAVFPDHPRDRWVHLFSGSLREGLRIDINPSNAPTILGSAEAVPLRDVAFIAADPPYTPADAERYGTKMPDRKKVMHSIAASMRSGGHLAWLDTVKPMYRKIEWQLFGEIAVVRSTNHRVRMAFLFERV